MMTLGNLPDCALLAYLKRREPVLYGRAVELRHVASKWLAYAPATFPHFTEHTVLHSDRVLGQISQLVFRPGSEKPVRAELSAVAAYLLAAAAYLHDSGMVIPDQEKRAMLASPEWRDWLQESPERMARWRRIDELRADAADAKDHQRHFDADLQTRFLLAELFRTRHAVRAGDVVMQHANLLAGFDLGDQVVRRTVADLCVGHGLRHRQLDDDERYPLARDVGGGQAVNVRLLAILLRLGDLLDMQSDRACPLLLTVANPLPADSLAHWTQYQRIQHRLTSPRAIEITAECESQSEHRLLYDWSSWIVDEVREASVLLARPDGDNGWRPPRATLDGHRPTIVIRPAPNARYIARPWRFELDPDLLLERLIADLYSTPLAFVRELLQNAIDATRCQLYRELEQAGNDLPSDPTQVDAAVRRRYLVHVSLRMEGDQQVLTVADQGIGMDYRVVERYFLQVGRSYYDTEEFRSRFRFAASSRFGVGFLSVFGVSEHVVVDTYRPESNDGPIHLTLNGPRSYLLAETSDRTTRGTRIEVRLKQPLRPGSLTDAVSRWCRRVEFPILIDDLGQTTTVEAEGWEQFVGEFPDLTDPSCTFIVRAFPVARPGVSGELYVLAHRGPDGEHWGKRRWAEGTYPTLHPGAMPPPMPRDSICLNGIAIERDDYREGNGRMRLDVRSAAVVPTLARDALRAAPRSLRSLGPIDLPGVRETCEGVLRTHLDSSPLAQGSDGWAYKQELVEEFRFAAFWAREPAMFRFQVGRKERLESLEIALRLPTIRTTYRAQSRALAREAAASAEDGADLGPVPALTERDVGRLSDAFRGELFRNRVPLRVVWLADTDVLLIDWVAVGQDVWADRFSGGAMPTGPTSSVIELPDSQVIGVSVHPTTRTGVYERHVLLNSRHPFVDWLVRVREACAAEQAGLTPDHFQRVMGALERPFDGWNFEETSAFLRAWNNQPRLPANLRAPVEDLTPDMLRPRNPNRSDGATPDQVRDAPRVRAIPRGRTRRPRHSGGKTSAS